MTRFMLMRQDDAEPQLIRETPIPLEKDLHDVLTDYPALLPAEDLGLGRVVVAGRESSLVSGYADLVLVDEHGNLCLVEVKKAGNPDTRQVVAQLLDYAASLWGQSLSEFETGVVAPYLATLGPGAPVSLLEHLASALDDDVESAEDRARSALDRLAQVLETGDFTLVVAAPDIPVGVQRVLEYLNEGAAILRDRGELLQGARRVFRAEVGSHAAFERRHVEIRDDADRARCVRRVLA